MEKILSVAIPTYNMEKYLPDCLGSFVCENMNRLEILIVNDGSKDNSLTIAQDFAKNYPETFIVIDKPNGGHGSTINAALKVATGKYFKVVDSDDLVETENINEFIEVLANNDADVVLADYESFYEDNDKIILTTQENLPKNQILDINKYACKFSNAIHNQTFKTNLIKDIRLQEHCFYVDVEFNNYSIAKCKTLFYTNLLIYKYRLGRAGQSVSVDGILKHRANHETVIFNNINFYRNLSCSEEMKQHVLKTIIRIINSHYINYCLFYSLNKTLVPELIDFDNKLKEFSDLYKLTEKEKYIHSIRKHKFKNIGFLNSMFKLKTLLRKLHLIK